MPAERHAKKEAPRRVHVACSTTTAYSSHQSTQRGTTANRYPNDSMRHVSSGNSGLFLLMMLFSFVAGMLVSAKHAMLSSYIRNVLVSDVDLYGPPASMKQGQVTTEARLQTASGVHDERLSNSTASGNGDAASERRYAVKPHINPNRTIELVHVGKAGGSTLVKALKIKCHSVKGATKPKDISRVCGVVKNPANATNAPPLIAKQVKDVFHMWAKNDSLISSVSSYLVTLRNPIDRMVSAYRYSHPQNCKHGSKGPEPWGCTLKRNGWLKNPQSVPSKLFKTCFPTAAMEDFCQSLGSPWVGRRNPHFAKNNLTDDVQEWQCRKLARHVVMGGDNHAAAPHMQYNYKYYYDQTMGAYPDKEVLGVRTESQWQDLVKLNVFVGGGNGPMRSGKKITHGSEGYRPSPLSQQAYRKLCCALADEIQIYANILNRVENISPQSKQKSLDAVYETCGIQTTATSSNAPTWNEWMGTCKKKLADDDAKVNRMAPDDPTERGTII